MRECRYCSDTIREEDYPAHLAEVHDSDELSRVDQKRVETHLASDDGVLGGMDRRTALALAGGAGATGVVFTGLGWRWLGGDDEPIVLQEEPDRIETRQQGLDGDVLHGTEPTATDIDQRIVVVSDSHWGNNFEGDFGEAGWEDAVEKALEGIERVHDNRAVDVLFHNGDMIHRDPMDHEAFRNSFFEQLPDAIEWYPVMGNHDLLSDAAWEDFFDMPKNYTVEVGDYVFIVCDTAEPGDPRGRPGADPEFLEAQIDAHADANGIFAVMHIPQQSAEDGTGDPDAVREQLARDEVVASLYGHRHTVNDIEELEEESSRIACWCALIGDERPEVPRGFQVIDVMA